MSDYLLSRILSSSVAIAEKAGVIVRDVMSQGDLGIVEKTGKNDLQTAADRSAQDLILLSLKTKFPELTVIGEETAYATNSSSLFGENTEVVTGSDPEAAKLGVPSRFQKVDIKDFTVWVDPLDGTKEYTEGFRDHVTVLIGIAVGDEAVAGVIHQPFFDGNGRTFYGIVGSGAAESGVSLKIPFPPKESKIVTTTRSHGTGLINDVIGSLNPSKVIKVGGAGHKVVLLIEGKAHAYVFPSPGCKKWDTCAPEAILTALGGKLTDIKGDKYRYHHGVEFVNEWGVLATASAEDHEQYVRAIPKNLSDQVKDYYKKQKV